MVLALVGDSTITRIDLSPLGDLIEVDLLTVAFGEADLTAVAFTGGA